MRFSTWSNSSSSPHLLDMSTAAPPMRNKQLVMSMFFSLPRYMQAVTFSWLMTSARLLGSACADAHRITMQAWHLWQGVREEAGAGAQPVLQAEPFRCDNCKALAGRSDSRDTNSLPQQAAPCKRECRHPSLSSHWLLPAGDVWPGRLRPGTRSSPFHPGCRSACSPSCQSG